MADRLNSEAIFLEHLGWIEKVAASACRKHGVWGEDAEDFSAWAKMKIMDDDYALLRRFRGESEIKTFIATVVVRLAHQYVRERWGRWRPSAAAERIGPLATELEMLVYRDGYPLEQAGQKLRVAGRTTLSDTELARLLARLPQRAPLRPHEVSADPVLDAHAGSQNADQRIAASQAWTERRELTDALEHAIERLDPEERMIVRMHFGEGRTVAEVARALRLELKPLYRHVERLRVRVRSLLEDEGIHGSDVRAMLEQEDS